MMDDFNPAVFVYHEHGAPEPLLPIDYSPFKMIELPRGFGKRRLSTQLEIVRLEIEAVGARQSSSPFGAVLGYEFTWRSEVSIFLSSKNEFANDPEPYKSAKYQEGKKARLRSTDEHGGNREYVIGFRGDGFCSLVAEKGQQVDDHQPASKSAGQRLNRAQTSVCYLDEYQVARRKMLGVEIKILIT
jgi:hypothetical protein